MPIQDTLDDEILIIEQSIKDNAKHITRKEYIKIVGKLKIQRAILIEQNNIIKASNKAIREMPTLEELSLTVTRKREENIKNEIRLEYSENKIMAILISGLADILPDNTDIQHLNTTMINAQNKYPLE